MGVKKGDCVTIYMALTPALPIAMLACARIGAIHCVVYAGFSAPALSDRIENSGSMSSYRILVANQIGASLCIVLLLPQLTSSFHIINDES